MRHTAREMTEKITNKWDGVPSDMARYIEDTITWAMHLAKEQEKKRCAEIVASTEDKGNYHCKLALGDATRKILRDE